MTHATAFLSYTRIDDEFHGGYITSIRKMLENAVHVVTGERSKVAWIGIAPAIQSATGLLERAVVVGPR